MTRDTKITLLIVGGLLVCGIGVFTYVQWRYRQAHQALEAWVDRHVRAGEPVLIQHFAPPPVPPEQDAAAEYRMALRAIKAPSDRFQELIGGRIELPPHPDDLQFIRAGLAHNQRALALAEAAAAKPQADWKIEVRRPGIEVVINNVFAQWRLVNLLALSAWQAADDGRDAEALARVNQILALARAIDAHPCLLGHLAAAAMGESAAAVLLRISPKLDLAALPRQAAQNTVDRLLDEADFRRRLVIALESERATQIDVARLMAEAHPAAQRAVGQTAAARKWRLGPNLLEEAQLMYDYSTGLIQACEAPTLPAFRAAAPPVPAPLRDDPQDLPIADRFLLRWATRGPIDEQASMHYRTLALRRLAATALALRAYAADHRGQYPPALAALVPKYLPAVPRDPLAADESPLRYLPGPAPRLYSVGPDATDDGGSAEPAANEFWPDGAWNDQDLVVHLSSAR